MKSYDAASNIYQALSDGGDPFGVNITDSLAQEAQKVLADTTTAIAGGVRRLLAVNGFEPPLVTIEYTTEGIYAVTYTVFVAGDAELLISRNGLNTGPSPDMASQGSPYAVTVLSAATDPSNSVAIPNMMDGLRNFTAGDRGTVAGSVGISFTIQLRDAYGNNKVGRTHSSLSDST